MTTQTLMGALQQSIRNLTGSDYDFNGDLHSLCDFYSIPPSPISGRLIALANTFTTVTSASEALNYFLLNPETIQFRLLTEDGDYLMTENSDGLLWE